VVRDKTVRIIPENPVPKEEVIKMENRNPRIEGSRRGGNDLYLFRSVVEEMDHGIAMIDSGGNLMYANPAFIDMFGYAGPEEVLGRQCSAFSEIPFWVAGQFSRCSFAKEFEVRRKDGSLFKVRVSCSSIFDAGHQILGCLATFYENIAEKRGSEQYKALIKKLQLMNNIMRHDTRNHLTALAGYLELCRESAKDPQLVSLLGKGSQIVSVINHQLDFAKYYQEIGISEPGWYRIADVIDKAGRQLFIPSLEIRPPVYRLECFADPLILKVFYNLFDNALRHGGDVTLISVDAREDPDGARIIVEDDGRGVPSGAKGKIFMRGVGENSGFGLFLSREILGITGMSIRETGDYGAGARFEILIPCGVYRSLPFSDS
jgi:PAS domain S-box-containing protein